ENRSHRRHRTDLSSGHSGCKSSGSAAYRPGVSFQPPVVPEYERADFWRDCGHAAPFITFSENQHGCHEPKRVLTKSCGTTDLLSVPAACSCHPDKTASRCLCTKSVSLFLQQFSQLNRYGIRP